jgi:hypothetical protein
MAEDQYPTPEQITALKQWAQEHGRKWKSKLREAWMTGDYGLFTGDTYLQQVRNTFGPSWLTRFRIGS